MISLFEEKKRGYKEKEALKRMLDDEIARLKDFLEAVKEEEKGDVDVEKVKEALREVEKGEIEGEKISRKVRKFLIQENILFYNPMNGTVRPQSRLLWRVIREVI